MGFAEGALHLLGEPDHLLAAVALGLLGGQQGRAGAWWMAVLFAPALLAGALMGASVPLLPGVEAVNLASLVVVGALVAGGLPLPGIVPGLLALGFGWGHGYAAALDLGGQVPPLPFVLGEAAAAGVLVAALALATSRLRARWQTIAVRALGSWICVIGLMVLALHLARH